MPRWLLQGHRRYAMDWKKILRDTLPNFIAAIAATAALSFIAYLSGILSLSSPDIIYRVALICGYAILIGIVVYILRAKLKVQTQIQTNMAQSLRGKPRFSRSTRWAAVAVALLGTGGVAYALYSLPT